FFWGRPDGSLFAFECYWKLNNDLLPPDNYARVDSMMYLTNSYGPDLSDSSTQWAKAVLASVENDWANEGVDFASGRAGPGVFIQGSPTGTSSSLHCCDPDASIAPGAMTGYWLAIDASSKHLQLRTAYDNSVLKDYGALSFTYDNWNWDFAYPVTNISVELQAT